ncbi:MAG: hypothetical protein JNK05_05700 [Myxococcales bacterium]|nr:hypothetical protein [Myxococcales bacterium]
MAKSKALALFVAAASLCGCALALEPQFFRPLAAMDATAASDGSASDGSIVVRDGDVPADGSEFDRVDPVLPDASLRPDIVGADATELDALVDVATPHDTGLDSGPPSPRDSGVDSGVDVRADARADSGSATDAGRPDVPNDSTSSGCPVGEIICRGVCTNTNNDSNNCGSCGAACGVVDSYCARGMCARCPFPMLICPAAGGGSCCGSACIPGGGCSVVVGEDAF